MSELRRLRIDDAAAAARVRRLSFDERLPWLSGRHSPDEDADYFRRRVFVECTVWGVSEGADLIGFIAFREGWVEQLYVLPGHQRAGAGGRLLMKAKEAFSPLLLWTFQNNDGARRFYEAEGFEVVQVTDGSGNEEGEPDVLYRWERGGA